MSTFFVSFKNKNLKLFLCSQLLSLTGGYIQNVALSAYITESKEKITHLGFFLFVSYLPVFLLSYFTGRLCNKIDSLKLLRVTELVLFAMSALLLFIGTPSYGMLLIFGGVWGTVRAFQTPASTSLPKRICDVTELEKGVAALNLVTSLARAAGPIISGVIYVTLSYRAAFLANTLSYIPSLVLLFKLKVKREGQTSEKGKMQLSVPLLLLVFTVSLLGTGYNIIYTGVSENLSLTRIWFSVFMALVGAGAAVGAWLFKKQIFISAVGISLSLSVLGFSKSLWICLPFVLFQGVCDYLFFTSALTKIQTENSKDAVPRAMGVYTAVTTGALPLGYLLQSYISQSFGVSALLYIASAVILIVYLLFFGKIR